jgi:RNA-directed DNA polymerase
METEAHPFLGLVSMRKLEALLGRDSADIRRIGNSAGRFYRPFDLRKTAGQGKWRHIDNPVGELKLYQSRILERMFHDFVFPETMIGAVPGRSIKDNAALHLRQSMVVALDLRDCFPRISDREVYRVFTEVLGCSAEISALLTKLTTFQHRLPQGAPTSPAIANLSLLGLHDELMVLAKTCDLNCSFYVDDIVFSGERALEVIEPAIRLIQSHGHAVRRDKIKRMPNSIRQLVTGVVVNNDLSVTKERRRILRSRLSELSHDGAVAERELRSILGEVVWVSWINSDQGDALRRSIEELLRLPNFEGIRIPKGEVRPCSSYGRHKRKQTKNGEFPELDQLA